MMEDAIKETNLADYNTEIIQGVVKKLIVPNNAVSTAKNIYYYVRDEIISGASLIGVTASTTLKMKKGFSQSKGNVAIALFRGAGIPARYRLIDFNEKQAKGVVDRITYTLFPLLRPFMPNGKIIHVIPQIHINDEWLNVDPLFDIGLFNGMKVKKVQSLQDIKSIDWSGVGHISPQVNMIKNEVEIIYNADNILTQSAKYSNFFFRLGAYTLLDKHYHRLRILGSDSSNVHA